jgi:hypothetical protein
MAQYDKSTEEFIKALKPLDEEEKERKMQSFARRGFALAAGAASGRPASVAANAALRSVAGEAIHRILTKEGGLSPTKLYTYLNTKYKDDWFDWEPETIWKTIKEDDGIEATAEIKNLIQSFQVLTNTNFAHESWHVFENVGHAINQNIVDFSAVQPLEVNEICYAIKVINAIRPHKVNIEDKIWDKNPEHVRPDHGFDNEIWAYVAASAKNSGLVFLPPELFGGSGRPQNILDNLLGNDINLKNLVMNNWVVGREKTTSEDINIQLARLKEIKEYIEDNHG